MSLRMRIDDVDVEVEVDMAEDVDDQEWRMEIGEGGVRTTELSLVN